MVTRNAFCWLVVQALLLGCGKSHSQQAAPAPVRSASASASAMGSAVKAPATSAPTATALPAAAEQLLSAWTAALNNADMTVLADLYADKVKFYGQSLARAQVVARKRQALAAAPGFKQQVLGQPSWLDEGDSLRVLFLKRSGLPGAQSEVRSMLVLLKTPRFAIREETDAVTEKRFKSASDEAKPASCEAAVWALVESTPFAKQLHADIERNLKEYPASDGFNPGGMGPFLPSETGGTYDVWIGVHGPERFESYAYFKVTPQGETTVECVECDASNGLLAPARSALDDFNRLCASQ